MLGLIEIILVLVIIWAIYGALYYFARLPLSRGVKKIVIKLNKDDKKISKLKL